MDMSEASTSACPLNKAFTTSYPSPYSEGKRRMAPPITAPPAQIRSLLEGSQLTAALAPRYSLEKTTEPAPHSVPNKTYKGRLAMRNESRSGGVKMLPSPISAVAVMSAVSEASKSGTSEEAVRSIMMTSTAKMMAATGALKSAASDADAAQPINSKRRLNVRLVCLPISEPMAAADCSEGPSKPPDPPNPTESELVINGANIQVRLMRPWRWDKACKMLGTPGPGCSPRSQFRTTHRVANRPIKGPIPSHQLHADHAAKPDMPSCNPPTTRFNKTANNPAAKPVRTAQPKSARSEDFQSESAALTIHLRRRLSMRQISLESSVKNYLR